MILDEKFVFYDQQSAKNLQSVLKNFGAKNRINEVIYNEQEDIVTGKLDDINRWLLAVSEKNEDIRDFVLAMHEKNLMIRDAVDNYLKDKSEGDFLYTHDELEKSVAEIGKKVGERMRGIKQESSSDIIELLSESIEISPISIINKVFEGMDVLEETEEGFLLKKKTSGGEMDYLVPKIDAKYCTGPAFSGLKCITIFKPVIKYEVTVNIIDIIKLDKEEADIIYMGAGMDIDDTVNLMSDYLFKRTIIGLILKGVNKNRGISAEELSDNIMNEWNSVSPFKNSETRLDLDPEIIPAFVEELKRAGLLSGNLNKIKPASAKSSKKRR